MSDHSLVHIGLNSSLCRTALVPRFACHKYQLRILQVLHGKEAYSAHLASQSSLFIERSATILFKIPCKRKRPFRPKQYSTKKPSLSSSLLASMLHDPPSHRDTDLFRFPLCGVLRLVLAAQQSPSNPRPRSHASSYSSGRRLYPISLSAITWCKVRTLCNEAQPHSLPQHQSDRPRSGNASHPSPRSCLLLVSKGR